jgi:hypothetical protein
MLLGDTIMKVGTTQVAWRVSELAQLLGSCAGVAEETLIAGWSTGGA